MLSTGSGSVGVSVTSATGAGGFGAARARRVTGAFSTGAFLTGAFLTGAFLAGAFFAGAFFAGALLGAARAFPVGLREVSAPRFLGAGGAAPRFGAAAFLAGRAWDFVGTFF